MFKYIFSSIFIVMLLSCSSNSNVNNTTKIKINPANNELLLSDLFSLNTILNFSGINIADISKITETNTYYIIQGVASEGDLHLFTHDGNYVKSIIKEGKGPNEVLTLEDFDYDPKTNTIHILCDYGQNILTYSIDKQSYNRIKLPEGYIARNFVVSDSLYYLYKDLSYSDQPEYSVSIFNSNSNTIVSNYLPLNKSSAEYIQFNQKNNLQKTNYGVLFYEAFKDNIYCVNEKNIEPLLSFDKGPLSFPSSELDAGFDGLLEFVNFCKGNNYIWAHVNMFYCDYLMISHFNWNAQTYLSIINYKEKTNDCFTKINDDILTHNILDIKSFNIIKADNQYIYLSFDPLLLSKHIDSKQINNDGNTIIIKLKINE